MQDIAFKSGEQIGQPMYISQAACGILTGRFQQQMIGLVGA